MRALIAAPLIAIALFGCTNKDGSDSDEGPTETDAGYTDADGDGYAMEDDDCNDDDANVHPNRAEDCNGIDDNCNGVIDEGTSDVDGDGICDALDVEDCDGVDNDGDGLVDEDFPDLNDNGIVDCLEDEECNGIDDNGDGEIDEGFDLDGDGFYPCDGHANGMDCDDDDVNIYPGANETLTDVIDNDCDGLIDEDGWAASDLIITEIMNNPGNVADPKGEWFEVYNASGASRYLNGITFSDSNGETHQVITEDPIELAAGALYLFGSNDEPGSNGNVTIGYGYSDMSLSNESDDLMVYVHDDVNGTVNSIMVDMVAWDDGDTFPDVSGASMQLEPSFIDATLNDDGGYWCDSTTQWTTGTDYGTPGEVNEYCTSFDHDGDGYSEDDGDCVDTDDTIYPGAPETDPAIDQDCDGVAESGPTTSAAIGSGSEEATCGELILEATDVSGTASTWEWTLTSAPSGSALTSADIVDATSATAYFYPDIDGSFEFSVTAWTTGDAAGAASTVTSTVAARSANNDPVADAGSNSSLADTADCIPLSYGASYECDSCDDVTFSLDGSATADADDDWMTYAWAVSSGPGTMSVNSTVNGEVKVSGPTPTNPSSTATSTVVVDLTVTDCMGGTDTSQVTVSYSCTGE